MLNNKIKSKNIYIPENNLDNKKPEPRILSVTSYNEPEPINKKPPMMSTTSFGIETEPPMMSITSVGIEPEPPMISITSFGIEPELVKINTFDNDFETLKKMMILKIIVLKILK